jgi:hypothetical protein
MSFPEPQPHGNTLLQSLGCTCTLRCTSFHLSRLGHLGTNSSDFQKTIDGFARAWKRACKKDRVTWRRIHRRCDRCDGESCKNEDELHDESTTEYSVLVSINVYHTAHLKRPESSCWESARLRFTRIVRHTSTGRKNISI